jgi:hypothetical protein
MLLLLLLLLLCSQACLVCSCCGCSTFWQTLCSHWMAVAARHCK